MGWFPLLSARGGAPAEDRRGDEEDLENDPYFEFGERPPEDLFWIRREGPPPARRAAAEILAEGPGPETEEGRSEDVRGWSPFTADDDFKIRALAWRHLAYPAFDTSGALRFEHAARFEEAAQDAAAEVREASFYFWAHLATLSSEERTRAWGILVNCAEDPSPAVHTQVADAQMDWQGPVPADAARPLFEPLIVLADGPDKEVRPPAVKALLMHLTDCPPDRVAKARALLAKYHAG